MRKYGSIDGDQKPIVRFGGLFFGDNYMKQINDKYNQTYDNKTRSLSPRIHWPTDMKLFPEKKTRKEASEAFALKRFGPPDPDFIARGKAFRALGDGITRIREDMTKHIDARKKKT